MNKQQYAKYLQSQEWQNIRAFILQRDEYRCRFCDSGLDLNVHHRSYRYIGREMKKPTDLVTVCRRCHQLLHVIQPTIPEPLKPKMTKKKSGHTSAYPPPKWTWDFYENRARELTENQVAREVALSSAPDLVALDPRIVALMQTFGCAMPDKSIKMLGMKKLESGWRDTLYQMTIPKKTLDVIFEAANANELKRVRRQYELLMYHDPR